MSRYKTPKKTKFEYTFYIGFVYLFFKLYIDVIEKVAPQNYFSPDILCVDHTLSHKVEHESLFSDFCQLFLRKKHKFHLILRRST